MASIDPPSSTTIYPLAKPAARAPLHVLAGTAETRDPDAVSFLGASGLPLSGVVLGLFDQSDDCIKLIDPEGRLQFMNCNGKQAMEIDDFSGVAGCSWDTLWPEESRRLVSEAVDRAKNGELTRFEAFCPTPKGTPKWWEVTVSPIRHEDGSVAAILSSSRDVSDRRHKEDALAAVAAEMKHRLRNAYTVGAAISLAMAKHEPEHREFATELANRLARLAEVQSALVDTGDIALADLVAKIVLGFEGGEQIVMVTNMPDVRLEEQRAKALILVLGELATNSLKYGSLSGRGKVAVGVSLNDGILELQWRETHLTSEGPLTSLKASSGSGQQLMAQMLATVRGEIDIKLSKTGYFATVSLRL